MAGTPLTPELTDKLLDKLGNDDAFRDLWSKDPGQAMQHVGAPKDFDVGLCLDKGPLASKETFRRSHAAFRAALVGGGSQSVHTLK